MQENFRCNWNESKCVCRIRPLCNAMWRIKRMPRTTKFGRNALVQYSRRQSDGKEKCCVKPLMCTVFFLYLKCSTIKLANWSYCFMWQSCFVQQFLFVACTYIVASKFIWIPFSFYFQSPFKWWINALMHH